MTITIIRSKQIPDTIELVTCTRDMCPDTWGIRHRDTNRIHRCMDKAEALNVYEHTRDEDDIIDLFDFTEFAA